MLRCIAHQPHAACRFTADPSGDSGKTGAKAEEAKEKTGGFLSGLLPKSNEGETSTQGKSLGDKASDKYDSLKAEANKTQDSIADQVRVSLPEIGLDTTSALVHWAVSWEWASVMLLSCMSARKGAYYLKERQLAGSLLSFLEVAGPASIWTE